MLPEAFKLTPPPSDDPPPTPEGVFGWDVQWSDFANYRASLDAIPPKNSRHFATREEAEQHKQYVRNRPDVIATIVATPPPRSRVKLPKKMTPAKLSERLTR